MLRIALDTMAHPRDESRHLQEKEPAFFTSHLKPGSTCAGEAGIVPPSLHSECPASKIRVNQVLWGVEDDSKESPSARAFLRAPSRG